jgi:hypothetical protein
VEAKDPGALRRELFDLGLATGSLDLHVHEPTLGDAGTGRPRACPVARWHALHGGPVTNRWHQEVRLDPALRRVLGGLDGTRTVDDLGRTAGCPANVVQASVEALAAAALIVG